jgi:hypothetical protein
MNVIEIVLPLLDSLRQLYFNMLSGMPRIETDDGFLHVRRVEAKLIINGHYRFEFQQEFSPARSIQWTQGLLFGPIRFDTTR